VARRSSRSSAPSASSLAFHGSSFIADIFTQRGTRPRPARRDRPAPAA
jgi:hypothetical protein